MDVREDQLPLSTPRVLAVSQPPPSCLQTWSTALLTSLLKGRMLEEFRENELEAMLQASVEFKTGLALERQGSEKSPFPLTLNGPRRKRWPPPPPGRHPAPTRPSSRRWSGSRLSSTTSARPGPGRGRSRPRGRRRRRWRRRRRAPLCPRPPPRGQAAVRRRPTATRTTRWRSWTGCGCGTSRRGC